MFVARYVGLAESTASDSATGWTNWCSGNCASATTASWTDWTWHAAARAVRYAADAAGSKRLVRLRGAEYVQHQLRVATRKATCLWEAASTLEEFCGTFPDRSVHCGDWARDSTISRNIINLWQKRRLVSSYYTLNLGIAICTFTSASERSFGEWRYAI